MKSSSRSTPTRSWPRRPRRKAWLGDSRFEGRLELGVADLLLGEELLEQVVVCLGDGFDERRARRSDLVGELGRHIADRRLAAVVRVGLHLQQVDETLD